MSLLSSHALGFAVQQRMIVAIQNELLQRIKIEQSGEHFGDLRLFFGQTCFFPGFHGHSFRNGKLKKERKATLTQPDPQNQGEGDEQGG